MAAHAELIHDDGPIWRVTNGTFPSNCYLCGSGTPGGCFIVDPGLQPAVIERALAELGLAPLAVLCTHGHFDHAGGAAHFNRTYGCPAYLHGSDTKTLRSANFLLMAFKIDARVETTATIDVESQDLRVKVGTREVRFHFTPGHTPGSCVIEFGPALFTGDTLYSRGVGLSKLPGEDPVVLRRSIDLIFDRFDERSVVCPGHGDTATLGWIRQNNLPLQKFMRATSQEFSQS